MEGTRKAEVQILNAFVDNEKIIKVMAGGKGIHMKSITVDI